MKYNLCKALFTFVLVIALIGLAVLAQRQVRANENKPSIQTTSEIFVTEQTQRGVLSRQLPEVEAAPLRRKLDNERSNVTATDLARSTANHRLQFGITLMSTPGLDAAPQAKAAVQRALAKWEALLVAPINVSVRIDFGSTFFGNPFPSPETIVAAQITSLLVLNGYPTVRSQLQNATANVQHQQFYASLPQDNLATELGSVQAVALNPSVGRILDLAGQFGAPDLIGFNANSKFDFDPSDGIDADKLDFEALVMREVGRSLGFISNVGKAEAQPANINSNLGPAVTIWDIFRLRSDLADLTLDTFSFATRAQLSGGEQVFFASTAYLPLSTGRPDGQGGDGRPAGHWKDNELTGQYLGIMDPTFAPGEHGGVTANDLLTLDYFGYDIQANARVMDVLSNDDNTRETSLASNGALLVSRFTPARFPFTLQSVRVQLPPLTAVSNSTEERFRLVVFVDPTRAGRPPVNPPLLLDRTITMLTLPNNRMLEVLLPNSPTIMTGDLYIGVQASSASLLFAGDSNVIQARSFISADNGASFQPLLAANGNSLNLIVRAVVEAGYASTAVPTLSLLSPTSVVPGGTGFTLSVYGKDFFGIDNAGFRSNSIVRWNGQDRSTEFINGSLLQAGIYDSDVASLGTARVTVFTPIGQSTGIESAPLEFKITPTNPAPLLTRLDPPGGILGGARLTLNILGRNFLPNSVVQWNGKSRETTFINSTQLYVAVTESDLSTAATAEITVSTPSVGASNRLAFRIAPCSFAPSMRNQVVPSNGGTQGVFIATPDYCRWTARSDVPWLTINEPSGALGRNVLTYSINSNNNSSSTRTGTVTIGDATITILQGGAAKSVSAASFTGSLAPESIASLFGFALTDSARAAETSPLPTRLNGVEIKVRGQNAVERVAPLFFVSPEQINFQVPAGTALGNATVFVYLNGLTITSGAVRIATVAPSLFAANANGQGVAAALVLRVKANGTQSFEPMVDFDQIQNKFVPRPIDLGPETDQVYLILFGTGLRNRSGLSAVSVNLSGVDAAVSFAGAQGDFVGLDQINVALPRSLRGRGEVAINFTADAQVANVVTVAIK
jgi:uncharacterized protein (TIGR03437 family)